MNKKELFLKNKIDVLEPDEATTVQILMETLPKIQVQNSSSYASSILGNI